MEYIRQRKVNIHYYLLTFLWTQANVSPLIRAYRLNISQIYLTNKLVNLNLTCNYVSLDIEAHASFINLTYNGQSETYWPSLFD